MRKKELYDALHQNVPKDEWFDYLHKILKNKLNKHQKGKEHQNHKHQRRTHQRRM